jgi:hypothetical protein
MHPNLAKSQASGEKLPKACTAYLSAHIAFRAGLGAKQARDGCKPIAQKMMEQYDRLDS